MSTIIDIEHLSKKYMISHQNSSSMQASLKEELTAWIKNKWNYFKRNRADKTTQNNTVEEFWALKEINFKIEEGDKLALLGRNGAGKSTLLKIISRIVEPTCGRLRIRGRVASVLEVGTGFHPELTGRENIFLNGAVIGMSYNEMKRKFDEIVAFADVEKFLDTPIKRYSSGMTTRLGFAVAAHLDSDLFIVDEALAVGDFQFQEKCLNKMNEIGSKGKTVLFVSHNVHSVLALCTKGIFLEKGELKAFEPIDECVNRYMRSCPIVGLDWQGNVGNDEIRIYHAKFSRPTAQSGFFVADETAQLDIYLEVMKSNPKLIIGLTILNAKQQPIAKSRLSDHPLNTQFIKKTGQHTISFQFDLSLFHSGEYYVKVDCSESHHLKIIHDEVLLRFAVRSNQPRMINDEWNGISLGNRWEL
jgi:lipopolysaccharide transport system ATP-binding protein